MTPLNMKKLKSADVSAIIVYGVVLFLLGLTSYVISGGGGFGAAPLIILFIGGVTVTKIAQRHGVLFCFSKWMYYSTLHLIISYIVFLWFWYIPLSALGDLRTPMQMPEYQDANYYDHLAKLASDAVFADWLPIINATWLSQGVVSYLGIIYKLFGDSQFNYLFVNTLLGYISVIFIQAIASTSKRDIAMPLLFTPFVLYYNITPGKEVLTNFCTYAVLCLFYFSWLKKTPFKALQVCVIIALLFFLALIRINALIMVMLVVAVYFLLHAKNRLSLLMQYGLIGVMLLILAYAIGALDLIYMVTDINLHLSQIDLRLQNSESSSFKNALANLLISDNFIINVGLAPIRMLIWIIAPFPFLDIFGLVYSITFDDDYQTFRSGEALMRSVSSLFMTYFAFKVVFLLKSIKKLTFDNSTNYILFVALGFTFILSSTNFIEGARYRTIVEPLAFCWLLLEFKQRKKKIIFLADSRTKCNKT